MKRIILSVFVISFALFGCKKSDKSCDLSQATFSGTYKITSLKYKADAATPEVDEYALWDACQKDDITVFNSNGNYSTQDAGTVCVPAGDANGIWTLSGSTIIIDGDAGTVIYFDCNSAAISVAGTTAGEVTTISLARQ